MRNLLLLGLGVACLATAGTPYMTEPALCPTRPELVFVSGGDIWIAPAKGGDAHLLVSHPAEESRPLYSPDGKRLAFVSTRTGNGDIYVLTLASGELKRLTYDDRLDQLDGWSRDGKWIYFSSSAQDVGGKNDIFRVSPDGGTPMVVSGDRFLNEFQAAPAPDGVTVAFAARGMGDSQWWRNGHSHIDESEIWTRKEATPAVYTKLVDLKGRNHWPMWSADGKQLYFMSDRGGTQNIWTLQPGGQLKPLTKFNSGRVLWPSIAYDGRTIVFEHEFRVWQLDVKSGDASAVPLTLVGSAAGPAASHIAVNQFSDMVVSPDGRKMALVGHGEIFATSARDGGDAVRVTSTPGPEGQVVWSPDSTYIAYVAERDAVQHIYTYDFGKRKETQWTREAVSDHSPKFSPDGKSLAYLRDRKELRVIDLESKNDRLLASGSLGGGFGGGSFSWSPDSKWIAYAAAGERSLRNLWAVPASGGTPHALTFLANAFSSSPQWSPDGKYLLYTTSQRTETPQIARVDLVPQQPKYTEERFEELFKPETPARGARNGSATPEKPAPKPVDINFDDIRSRLTLLPIGLEVNAPQISPDGQTLLVSAEVGGQVNLYLYPLEENRRGPRNERVARQLTSTAAMKGRAQFSLDGKEVFYLEGGRPQVITVESRQSHPVAVTAAVDVQFDSEKMAVFEEAWAGQRDNFYDEKMHGVDWNAMRRTYAPLIEASRTPDEMRRLLRLMVGELNASHSGISAPFSGGGGGGVIGQTGLVFDRAEYEQSGKLKVLRVVSHSPAELAQIKVGEEVTAVDGVAVGAHVNFDSLLEHKVGKRVALTVAGREVTVRPVGSLSEQIYREWVEANRAYVAKVSNGKLGYVHMRDMSSQALTQLYLDLDSENRSKEGVVIDIRNNNGGFVNAYALDVLSRRPYLTMTNRGAPAAPARTQLGQRSLELPTVLVTNQHSLSDAEDFTEGYRAMKLGKVVGEPTAGWIIYTGAMELVDGTTMRMPGTLITGVDGKNMENNPRPVDIGVTRPVGETYTGRDSQLDAAVKVLLK